MSSVRMCDKCGTVFSELDTGWQTFSAVTYDEDDNGNRVSRSVMMDACSACALVTPKTRKQRELAQAERDAGIADDFTLPDIKPSDITHADPSRQTETDGGATT